jgi:hypothetical protein
MRRLTRKLAVSLALASTCALAARTAHAVDQGAEAAAQDAVDKAAGEYQEKDYATAAARLEAAAQSCDTGGCSPLMKAMVLRDLGSMHLLLGDKGAAYTSFASALALRPDLPANPAYDSPELRRAWEGARAEAARNRAEAQAQAQPQAEPSAPVEQPSGDFAHTPAAAQRVNTPLPVYAEYKGSAALARVVLKYRGTPSDEWRRIDLVKMGNGWAGAIPCADLVAGTMRYWLQGFDEGGDPMASSGEPTQPYTVPIKSELSGDGPHLPGSPPPRSCAEGGDGSAGATASGPTSSEGSGAHVAPRWWFGASFALDLLVMPSGKDLCKLNPNGKPANDSHAYCTDAFDGSDFPTRDSPMTSSALVPGRAGDIDGGLHAGNVRVMLSVDYALLPNLLVGGRLGWAFGAYPGKLASTDGRAFGTDLHIEARATYLLPSIPVPFGDLAPMGFAATGLSEFDGSIKTTATYATPPTDMPQGKYVNVWVTDGPWFLALGGGGRYQIPTSGPPVALTAALRLNFVVGQNGLLPTFGPELGAAVGF